MTIDHFKGDIWVVCASVPEQARVVQISKDPTRAVCFSGNVIGCLLRVGIDAIKVILVPDYHYTITREQGTVHVFLLVQ